MSVDAPSCKVKMVVILASALAVGIGAAGAWAIRRLCHKPTGDGDNDDRETAAAQQEVSANSQPINDSIDGSTDMRIECRGFDGLVKLEIAPRSTENQNVTVRADPPSSETDSQEIRTDEETTSTPEAAEILPYPSRNADPRIFAPSISARYRTSAKNTEKIAEDAEESTAARSLEVAVRVVEVGSTSESTLLGGEEDASNIVRTIDALSSEPSNVSTARIPFATRRLGPASNSIATNEGSEITTNFSDNAESSQSQLVGAEKSEVDSSRSETSQSASTTTQLDERGGALDKLEEAIIDNPSATSRSFERSRSTGDSSISSTDGAWTARESENSSATSEDLVVEIIESSITSNDLETITEVLSHSSSSEEAASPAVSSQDVKKSRNIPDAQRDEEHSLSASSSRESESEIGESAPFGSRMNSVFPTECFSRDRPNTETKNISRAGRVFEAFAKRIRKMKSFSSATRRKEKLESSVSTLPSSTVIPEAQSTLLSENQPMRRSTSVAAHRDLLQRFDDPRISIRSLLDESNCETLVTEGPLDLSMARETSTNPRENLGDERSSRTHESSGSFATDENDNLISKRKSRKFKDLLKIGRKF